jgi:hypothetical protein
MQVKVQDSPIMCGISSSHHFTNSKIDQTAAAASLKEDAGDFSVEALLVWGTERDFTYQ